jgi:hypothetical protein
MTRVERLMQKALGRCEDQKWPRFQVELPPEMAEELMRLHRIDMGVNASAATRQGVLRSALLEWWDKRDPEPAPAIEGSAVDVVELLELPRGG